MDKQIVKNIIIEKQETVPFFKLTERKQQFGARTNYVLVGLRRAGKSYLLYQDLQQRIADGEATAEDILYINFEDERLVFDSAAELGIVVEAYNELYPGRKPWIYLDEIQIVDGWEKFARRLADMSYRVMVTGSNAKMLSREMVGALGGRYIPREVFPFSFSEYLTYQGVSLTENWMYSEAQKAVVAKAFDSFFYEGGIAESFEQIDKREYLNALYQKILIGDIVERNSVRNPRVFRLLARKLADSVMQPSSLTRLQHIVKSTGENISLPSLKDYLGFMQDAYLFFPIPNLASPISEQVTVQKRYMADQGILNLFLFQGETKLLENVVAIELNRRFRNTEEETLVYFYNRNVEVDFCIPSKKLAIQVSFSLHDTATRDREVGSLLTFLKANEDYKGLIVTRDSEEIVNVENHSISVIPIWKWLLMEV